MTNCPAYLPDDKPWLLAIYHLQGMAAFEAGVLAGTNPFPKDSPENRAWRAGWWEAAARFVEDV